MKEFLKEYYKPQRLKAKDNGVKKIPMKGLYLDICEVKKLLEPVAEIIYNTGSVKGDAVFCGWDHNNPDADRMWKTLYLIQSKFEELYGIICAATEDEEC